MKRKGQPTFWVNEFRGEFPRVKGVTNYMCIRDVEDPSQEGSMDWTDNIHEAVQFSRQEDAQRFGKVFFWADSANILACEHMYDDGRKSTQPSCCPQCGEPFESENMVKCPRCEEPIR